MPKCIIHGHDHELNVAYVRYQKDTGIEHKMYECPTGNYRFMCVDGREPVRSLMFKRPRYGWGKPPENKYPSRAEIIATEELYKVQAIYDEEKEKKNV